jgi:putative DNA primase/helicase
MPHNGENEIRRIVDGAPDAPPDDDAEIARLAKLPELQYQRQRKDAAKSLGCTVSILDRLVAAERGNGTAPGQGRPLNLADPEPWPEPIDVAALLGELAGAVRRHVVLDQRHADAVALWALGVHAFDAWTIFPRLLVTAPEKGCGKSTLMDVLSRLVVRPLAASGITAAALFRTIEAARPTLLLDEADAYARNNEDLRAVLDAGHRRDGAVIRTVGDNHEPRQFSAWAPIALAAIGHLPGTIKDRSVIINLRRRRLDEPVEPLRRDRANDLDMLARKAARWAADHRGALAGADPAMPDGIYNRAADNWRPLLAVADLAGGDWPDRGRRAALELARGGEDSESARVLLLSDIRELFDAELDSALFTAKILAALSKRDDRPWPEWKAGKPITARQMAAMLKPFDIATNNTIRRGAERRKGYRRDDFVDAWARYLPPHIGDTVTTGGFRGSQRCSIGDKSVPCQRNVTDENPENPSVPAGCHRVTDRDPLWWRNDDAGWPQPGPDDVLWGDDE